MKNSLSLSTIASWFSKHRPQPDSSEIRASIPALQRGLVWKPQQIEILWDSILRGFPIGSFTVCERIPSQDRSNDDPDVTHHLLDGQQRAHGISLGFEDPYADEKDPPDSVLWIDLSPTKIPGGSTRQFLIRLTTRSHPWGYHPHDDAKTLNAHEVRLALESLNLYSKSSDYTRPKASELGPFHADAPVPLSWVIEAFKEKDPWDALLQRLRSEGREPWKSKTLKIMENGEEATPHWKTLSQAIGKLKDYRIVALPAPDLLQTAPGEESTANDGIDISHIEHLFQRLNQQGTRLDGEELAYSMIKAYWPDIASPVDSLNPRRMPSSRLVSTVLRAAQTSLNPENDHLQAAPTVSSVRKLAAKREESDVIAITDFFLGKNSAKSRMASANEQIEQWLVYSELQNPHGLLPVHMQMIAKNSPDLYALLFYFADRWKNQNESDDTTVAVGKSIRKLVARIHWFAVDPKAARAAVQTVYSHCHANLTPESLLRALDQAEGESKILALPDSTDFGNFITTQKPISTEWTWWGLVAADEYDEATKQTLQKKYWPLIPCIIWNRELLLYAQRHFIGTRFKDYDPAQRDHWEGHNRPWDFDHIHAYKFIYDKRRSHKPWIKACREVHGTIGNLRAWPFEENRSHSAQSANYKIETQGQIRDSYLTLDEIEAYSAGEDILHDDNAATTFIRTCIQRISRIYGEVYQNFIS